MRHASHILAMLYFLNQLPDVYVSKMTMITKFSCFVGCEFQDVCVWNVMTYDDMWHDSWCTHTFLGSLCKMMWTFCSLNVVNTMPVSKIYSSLFAAKKWTLKLIELQLKHSKTCSKFWPNVTSTKTAVPWKTVCKTNGSSSHWLDTNQIHVQHIKSLSIIYIYHICTYLHMIGDIPPINGDYQ